MKEIPGIPPGREYTTDEFETANERVRAAREALVRGQQDKMHTSGGSPDEEEDQPHCSE